MVRFGLDNTIVEVVRQGNLRWLGYVVRKGDDDCVKQAWNLCRKFGVGLGDAYDKWRERVRSWKKISDSLEKKKVLTIIK